jgi:LPS-assembly protein
MMKKILFVCAVGIWGASYAKDSMPKTNAPLLLKADQLRHEEDLGLVVAEGHVVTSNGQQIVEADRLVYNKKLHTVTATGNVFLYEEDGSVVKSNYVELSDSFQDVFLQKAYLTTPENEKIAANLVQKEDKKTTYTQAVYSPCRVCKEKEPLWQIKAKKVFYDETSEDVSYEDATLEFKGVPVFYTPYFSHPSPRVKRRTGFLGPILGSQTHVGLIFGAPYYIDLAPNKDMTLTPVITTKQGPMLAAEYRHRFKDATMTLRGSATKTGSIEGSKGQERKEKRKLQGHVFGQTSIDLSDHWHLDGQVLRSSSPLYLKRYPFLEGNHYWRNNYLESFLHAEGFYDQNYIGVHGYHFQNLRSEIANKSVPDVIPVTRFSYFSPSMAYGSYFHVTGETLSMHRRVGTRMNRASTTAAWILPYTAKHGSLFELKGFVRADYYDIHRYAPPKRQMQVNGDRGRLIPGATLSWRFPFMTTLKETRLVIEPIIKGVLKPHGVNSFKIPNEDSQDFEFDSRNLFSDSRFIGRDIVDDGQHISYGVNVNAYGIYGVNMRAFLGQSYDFSKAGQFAKDSGVRRGASDYLGRFKVIPSQYGSLEWRFRADNKTGSIKRNVITLNAGPKIFNVQVDYLYHDNVYFDEFVAGKREQISWKITSKITRDWSLFVGSRHEFKNNPGPLESSIGAIYEDECFKWIIEGMKSYYRDRDLVPATTVMLTFGLKNLGDISTGRIKSGGITS